MNTLKAFDQYKMVIMTLDDLVFNLNQLRYDFLQLLYPKTYSIITYQEYTRHLGTIDSMYSFMEDSIKNSINERIEHALYNTKNLHNITLKESADALLNYIKSKGIKVILLTTHDQIKVKQLLAYRHLLEDVDQVISLSETCGKEPSIKLFHALSDFYHIDLQDTLLITSLTSLLSCVEYSTINSLFVPDNKNSYFDPKLSVSSMNTLFDVLQYALFGKYTSTDMYKEFLGYDENMNETQRRNRYSYLKMKYENNPEILPIVDEIFLSNDSLSSDKTQAFQNIFKNVDQHFEELEKQEPQEEFPTFQELTKENQEEPIIEEEIPEIIEEKQEEPVQEEIIVEPTLEKTNENEEPILFDTTSEFTLDHLEQTKELEKIDEPVTIQSDKQISEIFDAIEDSKPKYETNIDLEEPIEPQKEKKSLFFLEVLLSAILNFLVSMIVIAVGALIYLCLYDVVKPYWFLKTVFDMIFMGYVRICIYIYQFLVPYLPLTLLKQVSTSFIVFCIMILICFIIICIYQIIHYFINKNDPWN